MINFFINFIECEHPGDQQNYECQVIDSGAEIINTEADYDSEELNMCCKTEDYDAFIKIFKETDAYDFAQISV